MNTTSSAVDKFLDRATHWKSEMTALRAILLECSLTETLKWGVPGYTWNNKNIVLIHGFREYCALLFFKGALLQDTDEILVRQTENVQSARQVRFTQVKEINKLKASLKSYVHEAIETEKAGLVVELRKTEDYNVPAEFQKRLDTMPPLKKAFQALTPGRQRQYILHFSQAKQTKTRESRIVKCLPRILQGMGLND